MSGGGTWATLPDLIVDDAMRLLLSSFGLTFLSGMALLTAPIWLQAEALRVVAGILLLVAAVLVWRRISWLRHLLRDGVEVKAVLDSVHDERGETDFRWATYHYDYAGRTYDHTIRGTDGFMPFATRHGAAIILLIDPERPTASVFVRSAPATR